MVGPSHPSPCPPAPSFAAQRPPPQVPQHWGHQADQGKDPLLSQGEQAAENAAHGETHGETHGDGHGHHELAMVKAIDAKPWSTLPNIWYFFCYSSLTVSSFLANLIHSFFRCQGFLFGGFACLASCFLFIAVLLLSGVRILDPRPNDIVPVILRVPRSISSVALLFLFGSSQTPCCLRTAN